MFRIASWTQTSRLKVSYWRLRLAHQHNQVLAHGTAAFNARHLRFLTGQHCGECGNRICLQVLPEEILSAGEGPGSKASGYPGYLAGPHGELPVASPADGRHAHWSVIE